MPRHTITGDTVLAVKQYGAKGDGVTDDTAAIQALITSAPAGSTIHFNESATFLLTAKLTANKRLRFTGNGTLRWTAGIAAGAAFEVTADGCEFDGVRMINPNELGNTAQGSARPYGIFVKANEVKITRCHLELFQNAIGIEAAGEWHDFIVSNNRIKDVIGAGDGAANTAGGNGEDRGDGIICWGASITITGNVVNAKPGTDARVGIHVEALQPYGSTPFVHKDAMAVIADNVVYGPFRRGLTNEEMTNCTISGNAVADSTWAAIAIPGARNTTVVGNAIKWTRTSADLHGEAWSPKRGAFNVFNTLENVVLANNTITVVPGAEMKYGFSVVGTSDTNQSYDLTIEGNHIIDPTETMVAGFYLSNGGVRLRVRGNKVRGFTGYGVYSYKGQDIIVDGNTFAAAAAATIAEGVHLEASQTSAIVRDNVIRGCSVGVKAIQRGEFTVISGNVIVGGSLGIEGFGTTGQIQLAQNVFVGVTSEYANISKSITAFANNGPRYGSVVWDPASIASGSGETSPDIPVAGAVVGDFVLVAPPIDMQGLTAFAYVASAGIVKIRLNNNTGAAVDRSSATWTVRLMNK